MSEVRPYRLSALTRIAIGLFATIGVVFTADALGAPTVLRFIIGIVAGFVIGTALQRAARSR
jgi:hypothetical protein